MVFINYFTTDFMTVSRCYVPYKIQNCPLSITHSAPNLGFIFAVHLTFSDQISALSKSCYSHIRSLRLYFGSKTASRPSIATSIVHSKLD